MEGTWHKSRARIHLTPYLKWKPCDRGKTMGMFVLLKKYVESWRIYQTYIASFIKSKRCVSGVGLAEGRRQVT